MATAQVARDVELHNRLGKAVVRRPPPVALELVRTWHLCHACRACAAVCQQLPNNWCPRQIVRWDDEEGRVEKRVMGRIVPGAILYMTSYVSDVFFATVGRAPKEEEVWRYSIEARFPRPRARAPSLESAHASPSSRPRPRCAHRVGRAS